MTKPMSEEAQLIALQREELRFKKESQERNEKMDEKAMAKLDSIQDTMYGLVRCVSGLTNAVQQPIRNFNSQFINSLSSFNST